MDRALFGKAIAFPTILYCFTDLILHNRFLQPPQQGLCVVEEKAQILGTKLVRRTVKSTDIAPFGFSIFKRRLDKNAYIHGGSRLIPKLYPTTSTTRFCPLPYALSQRRRKKIEEPFGWAKTVGGMAQTVHRGLDKVRAQFTMTMAACNLARLPKLLTA